MAKGRTKRRSRGGGGGKKGGLMIGMRSSFKNVAGAVAGGEKPKTRSGQILSTVITVALLIAAAALLLRRYF